MTLRGSTGNENGVGHTLVWKPQRLCPFVRPTTPIFRAPKDKPQRHEGHKENTVIFKAAA